MNYIYQRAVFVNCEGLLTKENNVEALCRYFIPEGEILFAQINHYDLLKSQFSDQSNDSGGDIVKYILPFLSGYGANNHKVEEYCSFNIQLVPGADKFLQWIKDKAPTFIMTTGYFQNIHAICELVGFIEENTISVYLDLDCYQPTISEKENIRDMAAEIIQLPLLNPQEYRGTLDKLPSIMRETFDKIETILSAEIPNMPIGKYLSEVEPVSNEARVQFLLESIEKTGIQLNHTLYFGESKSDRKAMRLVKEGGGMTVAFNGDKEALREAEMACMAINPDILTILCDHFFQAGRKGVVTLAEEWGPRKLDDLDTDKLLTENLQSFDIHLFPRLELISDKNLEALDRQSKQWRDLI